MKKIGLSILCCLSLFSLSAQNTQPIQSETVLRILQAAGKIPGRYNALILFEHKVFNYAFISMQMTIEFCRSYQFPGPIVVVMRSRRYWSDRQIINQYYRNLAAPVLLDTFGIFQELNLPDRIMPLFTIWDSTGTLRYATLIPAILSGQVYQRIISRLDSLPPQSTIPGQRLKKREKKIRYLDAIREHVQSLPLLTPKHQIYLQDDSTTFTGQLQLPHCSSSEHWIAFQDVDQEVVRVYQLPSGKEFATIAASPQLHRLLSPVPLKVLAEDYGALTYFADFADFIPGTDSLVTHQFYTVIDSLVIKTKADNTLDTGFRLGKRYVLAIYAPPYDSIARWVQLHHPENLPYIGIHFFQPTITPWHTALFPVVNWIQQHNPKTRVMDAPIDPQSPEFEANDPLIGEYSLSNGQFIRYYGDLSSNCNLLGIGYRNFMMEIDCDETDCAYVTYYHDTLHFLRSGKAYPIRTYYPISILHPNIDSSLLRYAPEERIKRIYELAPIHPIDLTITESYVSIVWYHYDSGESIWQIYNRSPLKLITEYRIAPSPLRQSSILPTPQVKVSKNLNLYFFDQSSKQSVLWIYNSPDLNIEG